MYMLKAGKQKKFRGYFIKLRFLCISSTLLLQLSPFRIQCVEFAGTEPGLLHHLQWQLHAPTTLLDKYNRNLRPFLRTSEKKI
jgi:hypothetical protein